MEKAAQRPQRSRVDPTPDGVRYPFVLRRAPDRSTTARNGCQDRGGRLLTVGRTRWAARPCEPKDRSSDDNFRDGTVPQPCRSPEIRDIAGRAVFVVGDVRPTAAVSRASGARARLDLLAAGAGQRRVGIWR
jgi:hypothetical protein